NQLTYFLPHLLAASTSSPFWEGELTGLMSYRTSVFSELPRTGPPEQFESHADYVQTVAVLQDVGLIDDASKIWWDARLSKSFPTIEMRATDICTDIDDAICLAAVYRCVLRMLTRLRRANQRWRRYSPLLIRENRWRAQRYGIDAGLVDFGQGEIKSFANLCEELLELIAPDAGYFGCMSEVEHLRTIVKRGTSAHRQIDVYRAALANGDSDEVAFSRVVDHLVATTVAGVEPRSHGDTSVAARR
ncbi:MAG: glutamate-cysteine ligase family protein, partial [Chloroflexota bacterium]|nr:glutamate-cysteine ligase family protein [Chloroflexota bacterium]